MFLKDCGFLITEVVFTGGEKSVWFGGDSLTVDPVALKKQRQKELSRASKIIGIKETILLGEPDSEVVRNMNLIHRLMAIIRNKKPEILLTLHHQDYHPDHRAVAEITIEAADRAGWSLAPHLGMPHRTPLVLHTDGEYPCRADFIADVSAYEKKIEKVMSAYGSQMKEKHKQLLRSIHGYRGYFAGEAGAAEAFELAARLPVSLDALVVLQQKLH